MKSKDILEKSNLYLTSLASLIAIISTISLVVSYIMIWFYLNKYHLVDKIIYITKFSGILFLYTFFSYCLWLLVILSFMLSSYIYREKIKKNSLVIKNNNLYSNLKDFIIFFYSLIIAMTYFLGKISFILAAMHIIIIILLCLIDRNELKPLKIKKILNSLVIFIQFACILGMFILPFILLAKLNKQIASDSFLDVALFIVGVYSILMLFFINSSSKQKFHVIILSLCLWTAEILYFHDKVNDTILPLVGLGNFNSDLVVQKTTSNFLGSFKECHRLNSTNLNVQTKTNNNNVTYNNIFFIIQSPELTVFQCIKNSDIIFVIEKGKVYSKKLQKS